MYSGSLTSNFSRGNVISQLDTAIEGISFCQSSHTGTCCQSSHSCQSTSRLLPLGQRTSTYSKEKPERTWKEMPHKGVWFYKLPISNKDVINKFTCAKMETLWLVCMHIGPGKISSLGQNQQCLRVVVHKYSTCALSGKVKENTQCTNFVVSPALPDQIECP